MKDPDEKLHDKFEISSNFQNHPNFRSKRLKEHLDVDERPRLKTPP